MSTVTTDIVVKNILEEFSELVVQRFDELFTGDAGRVTMSIPQNGRCEPYSFGTNAALNVTVNHGLRNECAEAFKGMPRILLGAAGVSIVPYRNDDSIASALSRTIVADNTVFERYLRTTHKTAYCFTPQYMSVTSNLGNDALDFTSVKLSAHSRDRIAEYDDDRLDESEIGAILSAIEQYRTAEASAVFPPSLYVRSGLGAKLCAFEHVVNRAYEMTVGQTDTSPGLTVIVGGLVPDMTVHPRHLRVITVYPAGAVRNTTTAERAALGLDDEEGELPAMTGNSWTGMRTASTLKESVSIGVDGTPSGPPFVDLMFPDSENSMRLSGILESDADGLIRRLVQIASGDVSAVQPGYVDIIRLVRDFVASAAATKGESWEGYVLWFVRSLERLPRSQFIAISIESLMNMPGYAGADLVLGHLLRLILSIFYRKMVDGRLTTFGNRVQTLNAILPPQLKRFFSHLIPSRLVYGVLTAFMSNETYGTMCRYLKDSADMLLSDDPIDSSMARSVEDHLGREFVRGGIMASDDRTTFAGGRDIPTENHHLGQLAHLVRKLYLRDFDLISAEIAAKRAEAAAVFARRREMPKPEEVLAVHNRITYVCMSKHPAGIMRHGRHVTIILPHPAVYGLTETVPTITSITPITSPLNLKFLTFTTKYQSSSIINATRISDEGSLRLSRAMRGNLARVVQALSSGGMDGFAKAV